MLSPLKRIVILITTIILFAYTIYIDNTNTFSKTENIDNTGIVNSSEEMTLSIDCMENVSMQTSLNRDFSEDKQTVALDVSNLDSALTQNEKISIAMPSNESLERINVALPIPNNSVQAEQKTDFEQVSDNSVQIVEQKTDFEQLFNIYTIKFSDSLWSIAKKCYGFDSNSDIQKGVFAIAGANEDLKNIDYLIVGKKLRIPKEKNFDFYYQNYVSYLRMRRGIQLPTNHVVQLGETLTSIAEKYYHDSSQWLKIFQANPSANSDTLSEGITLHIPK